VPTTTRSDGSPRQGYPAGMSLRPTWPYAALVAWQRAFAAKVADRNCPNCSRPVAVRRRKRDGHASSAAPAGRRATTAPGLVGLAGAALAVGPAGLFAAGTTR
jgi:hypothetical protein